MRKSERHQLIKWMIKEEKLGTQKDIQKRLEAEERRASLLCAGS